MHSVHKVFSFLSSFALFVPLRGDKDSHDIKETNLHQNLLDNDMDFTDMTCYGSHNGQQGQK